MKISVYSKKNLDRDKRVLGKKWNTTYNSYFSDTKNIESFIKVSFPYIKDIKQKNISILYVGSAMGVLGEELVRFLGKHGMSACLTLVDISKKHLLENKNKETKKVQLDMLDMHIDSEFDVIIMRSSLDYLPTQNLQIKALKNIKKHLSNSGMFINCVAAMPTNISRDIANQVYASNNKIGTRHFQSQQDIHDLYEQAGFSQIKYIGSSSNLVITEKEHKERYHITQHEIKKIQNIIHQIKSKYLKVTEHGYYMEFIFPIYLAKK